MFDLRKGHLIDMSKLAKIKLICTNFIYAFRSIFWKRDKSVLLFGAWFGMKFADNPRFLYQYLHDNKEKYNLTHVVWVTWNNQVYETLQSMGYEVYMMDSAESIYYHKKAYAHFACDGVNGYGDLKCELLGKYSFGAKRVNLWHGFGNKAMGFVSNDYKAYEKKHPILSKMRKGIQKNGYLFRNFIYDLGGWGNCLFCAPSEESIKVMESVMAYKRNRFIKCGYARNCSTTLLENEKQIIDKMKEYQYTILYLPTFRIGYEEEKILDVAEEMKVFLQEKNILWLQKKHSADSSKKEQLTTKDYIVNLDTNFDINVLMPQIDILVTDYSSCSSDAMYHKKQVIYYVPDFDKYCQGSNGFIRDPESVMCGVRANNVSELESGIIYCLSNLDTYSETYLENRQRDWEKNRNIEEVWSEISSVIYD